MMRGTPSRLADRTGVWTIIVTTARATTTTEATNDAMTATTTVTAASHRTRGVYEPLVRVYPRTNVPRYDGDTNPSMWLKDYRLACHAGGAMNDLFIIKNLPLFLGDSARTWVQHILRTTCGSRTGGWSLPCVMSD
jgi:hypothetical protein